MQNITVISTGDKITKTDKPYKQLTVREENGTEHKVNIWSDFPNFANITIGTVIRGKLEANGQYMNLISELQVTKPTGHSGAFKQAQIKETMDIKRQDIQKSQENKELSIKIASTMRMAVDLAIAEWKDETVLDTLEQGIRKWRAFCWENWDASDQDFQAFP